MKDDYLWDKSGEPDPEIEHLERVLCQLRAKSDSREMMRAFENLPRTKPRTFSKALALAAAIAFAALALGTFVVIQRQSKNQDSGNIAMVNPVSPATNIAPHAAETNGANPAKQQEQESDQPAPVEISITKPKRPLLESRRRSTGRSLQAPLNEREQAEGLMAKEQLIKALQITSSKLNSVQKKVQGDERQGPTS